MKQKSVFVCQNCGNDSPKWAGQCPFCGQWNTLVETIISAPAAKRASGRFQSREPVKPLKLSQIENTAFSRLPTAISELDRVLGGGLVPGSVILLAGEPGVGKSTLALQLIAAGFSNNPPSSKPTPQKINSNNQQQTTNNLILYITGEESLEQIKIRAQRLGLETDTSLFLAQTDVDTICDQINKLKPNLVIIDSVQTLYTDDLAGPAGSVGQVKEATARLIKLAKLSTTAKNKPGPAIILIGQVTKEGAIAGPKVLEHMVDAVITLEGEKFANFRLLRSTKNRFGATSEIGLLEMTDKGMKEVANSSQLFTPAHQPTSGSVITVVVEGTRPMLVEIQALTTHTQLPIPRRVGQGVNPYRLQLITAILAKRLGLPLGNYDIFVNVAGGMRIEDPGADLGIALAIYSSISNKPLPAKTVVFGELGLLGEIRPVFLDQQRTKEAKRMGFTKIISPANFPSLKDAVKF